MPEYKERTEIELFHLDHHSTTFLLKFRLYIDAFSLRRIYG